MRRLAAVLIAIALWTSLVVPVYGVAGPALTVDLTQPTHPISPYIYGMNYADPALAAQINLPLNRWGGNDTSRYSYLLDTSSKGSDWYFSNIPYRQEGNGGADLPDESMVNKYIEQNDTWGGDTIVTIPMIGWMPKAEAYDCSFPFSTYPDQTGFEPFHGCGTGIYGNGSPITGNNPALSSVAINQTFVSTWVNYLEGRYGAANAGGVRFYNLDNETMLWNSTHRDVYPNPLTYDELRNRTYLYGAAVKAADPTALTLGPVGYGPTEYFYSALDQAQPGNWWENPIDRNAHGGKPLAEWYLEQMALYEANNGVRILDYFDEHFYPQAPGVTLSNNVDPGVQALRLRSTRALWDPTYTDESWIADTESAQLMLIPRMQAWVNENYPGTKTAITEYNWGGLNHINGALAQADVLGIFGREGLDLATLWAPPSSGQPGAYAFRMYLNYDGAGSDFGNVSVSSISADQSVLAIYGATRSSDGALTLMVINKTGNVQTSSITVTGFNGLSAVDVFEYSPANLNAIGTPADATFSGGVISQDFPANSITLLVVSPAAGTPNELLFNRSFEDGLTEWEASNPTGDKVKCDALEPTKFAHSGICGLMLKGGITTAKFTQTLVAVGGLSGEDIVLSAWGRGKSLAAKATVKAKLTTSVGDQKVKFSLPMDSYPFEAGSSGDNLIGDLLSGKVQITIKPGGGKVYVDDVSLTVYIGTRGAVLPPPQVPPGFRQ